VDDWRCFYSKAWERKRPPHRVTLAPRLVPTASERRLYLLI
jgi:hypothetical protein